MVERLAALPGGGDEDLQLLANLDLAHVFLECLGAQSALHRDLVGGCGKRRYQAVGLDHGVALAARERLQGLLDAIGDADALG